MRSHAAGLRVCLNRDAQILLTLYFQVVGVLLSFGLSFVFVFYGFCVVVTYFYGLGRI